MPDSYLKKCAICNATLPVPVMGKTRKYCSRHCYKIGTKRRGDERQASGLCRCGRVVVDGIKNCQRCREGNWVRGRNVKDGYRKENKCANCANQLSTTDRRLCERCTHNKSVDGSKRRIEMKQIVITAYGGVCVCCGETEFALLTIDHVNNDGNNHRKRIGKVAYYIYRHLIQNGFPKDNYQLLCWNCNLGKHLNKGKCPHEDTRMKFVA